MDNRGLAKYYSFVISTTEYQRVFSQSEDAGWNVLHGKIQIFKEPFGKSVDVFIAPLAAILSQHP